MTRDDPEELFEPARKEYLKQSFPGDLVDLLEAKGIELNADLQSEAKRFSNQRFVQIAGALVAIVVIAVTIGVLFWLPKDTPDQIGAKTDATIQSESLSEEDQSIPETNKNRVPPPRIFESFRSVKLGLNFSTAKKSNLFSLTRLDLTKNRKKNARNSTFAFKKPTSRKGKLFDSGSAMLAQRQTSASAGANIAQKMTTKPKRTQFRSRIRFEPIPSYRRS